MKSYEMLRRLALLRADVSKELIASIIRVKRISDLGTLVVTSNRSTVLKLLAMANVFFF
jgi:hypothetical protein